VQWEVRRQDCSATCSVVSSHGLTFRPPVNQHGVITRLAGENFPSWNHAQGGGDYCPSCTTDGGVTNAYQPQGMQFAPAMQYGSATPIIQGPPTVMQQPVQNFNPPTYNAPMQGYQAQPYDAPAPPMPQQPLQLQPMPQQQQQQLPLQPMPQQQQLQPLELAMGVISSGRRNKRFLVCVLRVVCAEFRIDISKRGSPVPQ
jgi:hypothetical protein